MTPLLDQRQQFTLNGLGTVVIIPPLKILGYFREWPFQSIPLPEQGL